MTTCALLGCNAATDDPAPVELVPGKSDDTTPSASVDFDESDPQWESVARCDGFGLCFDVLVAGRDRSDFEAEGFSYPMQRVIDELFFASDLRVSPNCEGKFGFDADLNVGCAPEDGEAFIFGQFIEQKNGGDSTWQWITYDYAEPGRARLFHHPESDTYYLDLK